MLKAFDGTDGPTPEAWSKHSDALRVGLGAGDATDKRIEQLYLPVYFWCKAQRMKADGGKATVMGISAPQGSGKSTLVHFLKERFAADGLQCATVSYDDFYLTHAIQQRVAKNNDGNRLLELRGNAGTHSVALGAEVLQELKHGPGRVRVPAYDKSLNDGQGDRLAAEQWPEVPRPDVVLVEGWMAGFKPIGLEKAALVDSDLSAVDGALVDYEAWDTLVDAWVVLAVEDTARVVNWRLQAEQQRRDQGLGAMSDEQLRDFVARFLPAYQAYLPALYKSAQHGGVDGKPTLIGFLDAQRNPVDAPGEREL
ncbi:P-loop containing nucleoside triphosphate hydrolase protein [Pelagophyceae sp. CCMP2097]|nr:P-loop containing nucleoside triphosphate hydrolase protein [Pelagophyceae sp. CCMP2097]